MENYINYAYVILITPTGKGYACYAIKKLAKNSFSVAASYCSPKDAKHFNKNKSRLIAKSRLNDENSCITIELEEGEDDCFKTIHSKVISNHTFNMPTWAWTAYFNGAYSLSLRKNNQSFYQFVEQMELAPDFFRWFHQLYVEYNS